LEGKKEVKEGKSEQMRQKKITEIHSNYIQNKERHEKVIAKRKRGLYRRLTGAFIVFSFFAFLIITGIAEQLSLLNEKQMEQKELTEEYKALLEEKAQLKDEVNKLKDEEYIGEIARRDFFMSKPGETIFKLPE
jgi:cell division protein DivIC